MTITINHWHNTQDSLELLLYFIYIYSDIVVLQFWRTKYHQIWKVSISINLNKLLTLSCNWINVYQNFWTFYFRDAQHTNFKWTDCGEREFYDFLPSTPTECRTSRNRYVCIWGNGSGYQVCTQNRWYQWRRHVKPKKKGKCVSIFKLKQFAQCGQEKTLNTLKDKLHNRTACFRVIMKYHNIFSIGWSICFGTKIRNSMV